MLEVYGEDTDRAYFAFQRITDVFLSGLLHKGALTKVGLASSAASSLLHSVRDRGACFWLAR